MHGWHGYNFEMSDDQHRAMAVVLKGLKGAVVVSGYAGGLYDNELFADWARVERPALADGARDRTEILWLNRPPKQGRLGL
jgi:DNA adenine methylase